MIGINPKYKGEGSFAIVRFEDSYSLVSRGSQEGFEEALNQERKLYIPNAHYKILKMYSNVNINLIKPVVEEVLQRLRKGEQVDLERILE